MVTSNPKSIRGSSKKNTKTRCNKITRSAVCKRDSSCSYVRGKTKYYCRTSKNTHTAKYLATHKKRTPPPPCPPPKNIKSRCSKITDVRIGWERLCESDPSCIYTLHHGRGAGYCRKSKNTHTAKYLANHKNKVTRKNNPKRK